MPDLGQVPDIDVPSYLPDLPGVADDLMYSADLGPGIAPSAPGAIPELPTFHTEVTQPFKPGGPRAGDGLGWALPCSASCLLRYLTLDFCPRPRGWGADGTPTAPATSTASPSSSRADQCPPTSAPTTGPARTARQGGRQWGCIPFR